MNDIKLIITEKDCLNSLLYSASKSTTFKKSRQNSKFIFAGIIVLLSFLFLMLSKFISIPFLIVGAICFIFFPQYLKWYFKKHFTKTIQSNEYKNLIGLENSVIFNGDNLEIKNPKSENKYSHSNFEYISETQEDFFIKLKTATILTFPKNQINNIDELKNYFKNLCIKLEIEYIADENWTWK